MSSSTLIQVAILTVLLLRLSPTAVAAQLDAQIYSLSDLVELVDVNSHDLERLRLDVAAARSDRQQATWQFSPSVSYTLGKSHLLSSGDEYRSPSSTGLSQVLSARWRVFDGLRSFRGMKAADLSRMVAEFEYVNARFEILARAASAYVQWQSFYARKNFMEKIRDVRGKSYHEMMERAKAGEIDLQESILFENQYRESAAAHIQASEDFESSRYLLNRAIGKDILRQTLDRPSDEDFVDVGVCDSDQQQSTAKLAKSRHGIVEKRLALNELRLTNNRWSYAPQVDLRLDYAMGEELLRTDETQNLRLLLQLNWEVFSGRQQHFEHQRLMREQKRLDIELQQLDMTTRNQESEYCLKLHTMEQRYQQLRAIVDNNRRLLSLAESKYSTGEISALDLVSYQTSLVTSEISLINLNQARQLQAIELKLLSELL